MPMSYRQAVRRGLAPQELGMWVWGGARGAVVAIIAMLTASAHANEAAQEMAEKFASDAKGAAGTPVTATDAIEPKSAAASADTAAKGDAERQARTARMEAARKKAQAARSTADAKRRAAAEAARAAERAREEERDMLARARLEANEMRAAAEEARLTEEARRLVIEAERERAKAEELLAGQPDAARPAANHEPHRSLERAAATRRLIEKLKRVRQIHATRLANRARREAEVGSAALGQPPQPVGLPSLGPEGA